MPYSENSKLSCYGAPLTVRRRFRCVCLYHVGLCVFLSAVLPSFNFDEAFKRYDVLSKQIALSRSKFCSSLLYTICSLREQIVQGAYCGSTKLARWLPSSVRATDFPVQKCCFKRHFSSYQGFLNLVGTTPVVTFYFYLYVQGKIRKSYSYK